MKIRCPAVLLLMLSAETRAHDLQLYPTVLDGGQIKDLVSLLGRDSRAIQNVSRDSTGTQVRVELRDEFLTFGCDGEISRVKKPAPTAWLDDSGKIVAWIEGQTFRTAEASFDLSAGRGAGVDPSGKFIFLWDRDGRTDVRAAANAKQTLIALDGEWRGFAQGDQLALVSQDFEHHSLRIQVFRDDNGNLSAQRSFEVKRKWEASSPHFAVDLDLRSLRLIEQDSVDLPFSFLTTINLVELESGHRERIARSGWVMFLQRNPFEM